MLETLDEENLETKRKEAKPENVSRGGWQKGFFNSIVKELRIEDTALYKEMLQMNHSSFLFILKTLERDITPIELMR